MCSTPTMDIVVAEFIVNTCRVCPQPNYVRARGLLVLFADTDLGDDITHIVVSTLTGSASELYIDAMLPCVGDLDVMFYTSNELVVPQGHHVTDCVQLPAEFHTSHEVELYEFIDTEYPGFVFTRLIGTLITSGNSGKYTFERDTVK